MRYEISLSTHQHYQTGTFVSSLVLPCKMAPKDVNKHNKIILHRLNGGKFTPCISPFELKLETYLRMADIPYQVNGRTKDE